MTEFALDAYREAPGNKPWFLRLPGNKGFSKGIVVDSFRLFVR